MKILIYPDTNHVKWGITQLKPYIEVTGVELAESKEDDFDVLLYWSYHKGIRPLDEFLLAEAKKRHIINLGGWDTTKTCNEKVAKSIYGYNTVIDPFTFKGVMAEKSEKQGSHDLTIIDSVKEKKKGYIYVELIDNRINETTVRDYRVFVYANKVELVLIKDKSIEDRFAGAIKSKIQVCNSPLDEFSKEEIGQMEDFCRAYDTEFTELDVVRGTDGRVHVLDNNNMPSYNPAIKPIFEADDKKILRYLSDKFYKMLERYED